MNLLVESLEDLDDAAAEILSYAGSHRIFLFYGDMGAGKTTLIKALCHGLGSADNIASPTFSIVNEYNSPEGKIYHFDFYRLKNQNEAMDMGFEEYLYTGNYCFIEWPEKIPDLLPQHYICIKIQPADDNARRLYITKI
jgi:tRNA threonylcarbamoyladenosine biosynthesis protein TsaE